MHSNIVVALDYADPKAALKLTEQLDPAICKLKVGKELFTAAGPHLVEQLQARRFEVFLDLKFHDIPNTVGKACEAASRLGVWMLNVHASGGKAMMQAAREGVDKSGRKPLLIAVTVLTSMTQENLTEIGIHTPLQQHALDLASLAHQAGLDGVVCSAHEASSIKEAISKQFITVTPGIRPASASLDDQSRVMTPTKALQMGADYLVIGRPITLAENPLLALQAIHQEIQATVNQNG